MLINSDECMASKLMPVIFVNLFFIGFSLLKEDKIEFLFYFFLKIVLTGSYFIIFMQSFLWNFKIINQHYPFHHFNINKCLLDEGTTFWKASSLNSNSFDFLSLSTARMKLFLFFHSYILMGDFCLCHLQIIVTDISVFFIHLIFVYVYSR